MQLDLRIGSRGPLHCGGAGKAMLAFMSEAEQETVLGTPLQALTANTITDPAVLRRELARVRQRGYSLDDQEVVMGVFCVAMPILDRLGRAVGAISITGPSPKQPGPHVDRLVAMLGEACGHVSRRLGYGGPFPVVTGGPEIPAVRGGRGRPS